MNYFDRQYYQDKLEIESIDRLLQGVWDTLACSISSSGIWPYEMKDGEAISSKAMSVSTQAMIHYALDVARGRIPFHEFSIRKRNGYRIPCAPKLHPDTNSRIQLSLEKSL